MLPYVVGVVLSIGVAGFAGWVGFDRDRAFYPAVLIVIASYYVLFAAMIGSVETAWCLAYDVGAALALAGLLIRADVPLTAAADVVGETE